jgi:predicted DNA-binding ribbon-helix-helix protein
MREAFDVPPPPARAELPTMTRPADRPAGIRLEPELWDALAAICRQEGVALDAMIRRIAAANNSPRQTSISPGLTSAVRVFIVAYYRQACRTAAPLDRSLQVVSESSSAS